MFKATTTIAILAFSVGLPLAAQDGSKTDLPERFTAVAMSPGGPRTESLATRVELTIDRWSTAEESARLMNAIKEQGAEAMLDVLRDLEPVGTIQVPGNLSYNLHYAHQAETEDGGRRIGLATDRRISYWEAVNQPRSVDYPFTFIELRLNGDGEGEGKLALATQVHLGFDGETLELVNYAAQPIQLNAVKSQTR